MRLARKKGNCVFSLGVLCALVMPMTNIFGEASAMAQVCGDAVCDADEDCETCPQDCAPECFEDADCDDGEPNTTDTCGDGGCCQVTIPTVSEWGLIVMTLLALTAGTIVFARRRRPAVT